MIGNQMKVILQEVQLFESPDSAFLSSKLQTKHKTKHKKTNKHGNMPVFYSTTLQEQICKAKDKGWKGQSEWKASI